MNKCIQQTFHHLIRSSRTQRHARLITMFCNRKIMIYLIRVITTFRNRKILIYSIPAWKPDDTRFLMIFLRPSNILLKSATINSFIITFNSSLTHHTCIQCLWLGRGKPASNHCTSDTHQQAALYEVYFSLWSCGSSGCIATRLWAGRPRSRGSILS
jgi:hypothetical protein